MERRTPFKPPRDHRYVRSCDPTKRYDGDFRSTPTPYSRRYASSAATSPPTPLNTVSIPTTGSATTPVSPSPMRSWNQRSPGRKQANGEKTADALDTPRSSPVATDPYPDPQQRPRQRLLPLVPRVHPTHPTRGPRRIASPSFSTLRIVTRVLLWCSRVLPRRRPRTPNRNDHRRLKTASLRNVNNDRLFNVISEQSRAGRPHPILVVDRARKLDRLPTGQPRHLL